MEISHQLCILVYVCTVCVFLRGFFSTRFAMPSLRRETSVTSTELYIHIYIYICSEYRKYRSLGTPPTLTFQARLLHNQEGANAEKGGFREISSRAFFRRIGRCSRPLGCGAIEPGKSVKGVCQDSDTYGISGRGAGGAF